ncbi:unnamed protein product [marine sediment metagenome]|uniref:Uncharacterized protein n=1 Tax=marine sediment metagenome TaxID=412755 RepID=X1E5L2_9ZZZZ
MTKQMGNIRIYVEEMGDKKATYETHMLPKSAVFKQRALRRTEFDAL